MKITERWEAHAGVEIRRTTGGVVELRGEDDPQLARGLGFCHAHDRMLQMMLVRLIAQGRLGECLQADDETLAVDTFARQMGFARTAEAEVAECIGDTRLFADAYCDGVNAYLDAFRRPLEFVMLGYRPEPWSVADSLATIKVMSYIGLAQTQADLEKLIIESIAGGVDPAALRRLFSPHLDEMGGEILELIGKVRLYDLELPEGIRWGGALPAFKASNNWALAASRSSTGSALQCNDPHLECNRLPAIWYEWIGHTKNDYRAGVTMPGVPGTIMGRSRRVSGGFTYGFMDMVDFFFEEVRDGRYRRGEEFVEFEAHRETIKRRKGEPITIDVRETVHGVLECDPSRPLEDGIYLSRAWSGYNRGAARSLEAILETMRASNVEEAMDRARHSTISCNWLFADRDGRIGFQQSGLLPKRKHSGLYPLPGWDEGNDWDGIVSPEKLSRELDPASGFLVTANEDVCRPDGAPAINAAMAPYRSERIADRLAGDEKMDIAAMKRLQCDLHSRQADRLLPLLEPYLPESKAADILRSWDRRYDSESRGAVLFERIYAALLREVFGRGLFGYEAWDHLVSETSLVTDYFYFFDLALLSGDECWFGEEGREASLRRIVEEAIGEPPRNTLGDTQQVMMTNLLFAGKLPKWLGFDHGPIVLQGGRATVVQCAIYRAHGRQTTFTPSWRYVTDLGSDEIETIIAGGPSARRTSKYYKSEVDRWLGFKYKRLEIR